ncbi:MAG: hypothetical protein AB8B55_09990 [Mariniblastus sp.]
MSGRFLQTVVEDPFRVVRAMVVAWTFLSDAWSTDRVSYVSIVNDANSPNGTTRQTERLARRNEQPKGTNNQPECLAKWNVCACFEKTAAILRVAGPGASSETNGGTSQRRELAGVTNQELERPPSQPRDADEVMREY